jgi:hypothetical protein
MGLNVLCFVIRIFYCSLVYNMKIIKKNKAYCHFCGKTPTEYTMKIKDERFCSIPFLIYMCEGCMKTHSDMEVFDDR